MLLARTGITINRALLAASDAIASFRVIGFGQGMSDSDIDAVIKGQLPAPSDRMAHRRKDVLTARKGRTVYAVVWDRGQVQKMAQAARLAGVEPAAVELKSLCLARAVNTSACLLLDLSSQSAEALLIQEGVPRVWHEFDIASDGDLAGELMAGLRPLLAFNKQSGGGLPADAPIYVRSEQTLASKVASQLANAAGHPVEPVPPPPRIEPDVRFNTYLTCIGLVMRRT